jgi:hypothetical protein
VRRRGIVLFGAALAAVLPAAAHAAPLATHATARPPSIGIGEPFTYIVEVQIDPRLVDPSTVTIVADAGPFAALGDRLVTRSGTTLRVEQRFTCLDAGCVPRRAASAVAIPPAYARGRLRAGGRAQAAASPLTVSVVSRVPESAVQAGRAPYRLQTRLPAASGATQRLAVGAGLVAALFTLLCLAFAVLATIRRPRAAPMGPREDPLARALRLLRESAARGVPDRRRAADLVARIVRARGARPLADEATRVAWSPEQPEPETATSLANQAEAGARR